MNIIHWLMQLLLVESLTQNLLSLQNLKKYSQICPLKRMAKTKEVIGAIIYLLSDSSSYTNGHTIVIDGGFSVW